MLKHIVVFKMKESADGKGKRENTLTLKKMLEDLNKIKGVRQFEVGLPMTANADWDIALYSAFDNAGDLEVYRKHPDHLKVVDFLGKACATRQVVDYEV